MTQSRRKQIADLGSGPQLQAAPIAQGTFVQPTESSVGDMVLGAGERIGNAFSRGTGIGAKRKSLND